MLRKTLLFLLVNARLISLGAYSDLIQSDWELPPIKYSQAVIPLEFKNEAVVVISDKVSLNLADFSTKTLRRTVLLKIHKKEGLHSFNSVTLPESFDIAENKELWQQGRRSKIKIPFISSFTPNFFIARLIKPNDKVMNLSADPHYAIIRWIKPNGEFANDEVVTYSFKGLAEGDLVEYSYSLDFKSNYGSDVLYLASEFPKMNVEYSFKYNVLPKDKNYKFILTENIPDSCITYEKKDNKKELSFITETISLKEVQKVNYFIHAMSAKQLPMVYFNMNYKIKLFKNKSFSLANLPDFSWTNIEMPNAQEFSWYTKFPNDIRKFVSSFPAFKNDSNNLNFLKAVIDTLNNFKYYSANYMLYNDPRLYNLYSTDHLFKRRISEMNLLHIYESLLNEKNVFYYVTNLQDKRLGEHNPLVRNRAYENIILAIPNKHSFIYFVPRYNGLKYYLDELPFYYQAAVAAMFPVNYIWFPGDVIGNNFRFIRTHSATTNENVRVENCVLKIYTDSLNSHFNITESLAGQFSTILRPLYLNEIIDSTVNNIYFKKCFNKPGFSHHKTILQSKSETFPFRYTFNCSGIFAIKTAGEIDLDNWFSFLFNKTLIPEKPTHDFYFDFEFSDSYNFLFEFDRDIQFTNLPDFNRTINNDYFELHSSLKEQDHGYLLSVTAMVKKDVLPKGEASKLMEFIDAMEELNHLKILYKK